jgi:hypothetical protein
MRKELDASIMLDLRAFRICNGLRGFRHFSTWPSGRLVGTTQERNRESIYGLRRPPQQGMGPLPD